jgi:hypothetical protein
MRIYIIFGLISLLCSCENQQKKESSSKNIETDSKTTKVIPTITKQIPMTTNEILNLLDENLMHNTEFHYPSFFPNEDYTSGNSRVTLVKNDESFTIIIEKLVLHDVGKFFDECFIYGNTKLTTNPEITSSFHNNVFYKTILDYDFFDKVSDEIGILELSRLYQFQDRELAEFNYGKELKDYSEVYNKSGYEGEVICTNDLFVKYLMDNNPDEKFYLSKNELISLFDNPVVIVSQTSNWYFEELIDEMTFAPYITKKPSGSILFQKAARVLSGENDTLQFDSSNSNWVNWTDIY